ncbi:MAG: hypothetical protein PHG48_00235 [Eubacteriales bacterium]|nr:hypothetical protein [Eubacteriales bacterium]
MGEDHRGFVVYAVTENYPLPLDSVLYVNTLSVFKALYGSKVQNESYEGKNAHNIKQGIRNRTAEKINKDDGYKKK